MLKDEATDTTLLRTSSPGFTIGLLTGGIIGAVLALAFAPRAGTDLRRRVARTAKSLGAAASDRYQDSSSRVADALDQITNKAPVLRDEDADAMARGSKDIPRFATSTKNGERPQPAANTTM